MQPSHSIVVIRPAVEEDVRTLAGLAILDSREELTGPALLAEVDGVARAALDLRDGSVAADPFAPTTQLVELLRLRAHSLDAAHRARRPWGSRAKAIVRRPHAARR
jgi:hypothetical protein